jgi:ring-1,2-phenylacetyl-CoA epoxidase subunit PaaE
MSSIKFHTLTIADIRRETADCVSIAFQIPTELKAVFAFTQGQYLTLKKEINGEEVRRSYSICSSPNDEELRVAIKKVEGGKFSTFANDHLSIGEKIEVMPPMGKFFVPLSASESKHYVGFASGSGITPIYSILKTTLEIEPQSTFTLFYGNKNAASVIFKEDIEALKNKYMERFQVYYILSREHNESPLLNGRLNGEKCEKFCQYFIDAIAVNAYFLCGPEEMIFSVKDTLNTLGVAKQNIHFELFTTSSAAEKTVKTNEAEQKTDKISEISIVLDGKTMTFPLAQQGKNILDAAMERGADLPYACKGGVCCTCKAKVTSGEVRMEVNYGLEEDEIAANYILTCQAHPISESVTVDFDV